MMVGLCMLLRSTSQILIFLIKRCHSEQNVCSHGPGQNAVTKLKRCQHTTTNVYRLKIKKLIN